MNVSRLLKQRKAAARRISWPVLFMKAQALVAAEIPQLRRLFLRYPYPRIYEHPTTASRMTISREVDGRNTVLLSRIYDVEEKSLVELDDTIRMLATKPVEEIELFQQQMDLARWPSFLRRFGWFVIANLRGPLRVNFLGTSLLTTVSKFGAVSINPPIISATTLSFGPIDDEGNVDVYLAYDHRIFDGAINAKALARLQEVLETLICDELASLQPDAEAKPQQHAEAAYATVGAHSQPR